jgi:hypothetical protein
VPVPSGSGRDEEGEPFPIFCLDVVDERTDAAIDYGIEWQEAVKSVLDPEPSGERGTER